MYSITAYVEADRAAKELGVRQRGGFFESDNDYASALVDGAFNKVIQVGMGAAGLAEAARLSGVGQSAAAGVMSGGRLRVCVWVASKGVSAVVARSRFGASGKSGGRLKLGGC